MQMSEAVANAMLDAAWTTIGANPVLYIFSGQLPANCAASDAGTQLASPALGATPMNAAASRQKTKNGSWVDPSADANGLGRHYRIKGSGGACHKQGLVSMPWAASVAVQVGQQMHNGGNVYVVTTAGTTASSGGPTGTGTGISDGTVTWNYAGPVEMTVDNVDIAAGQTVTVTGYTETMGGA